MKEINLLRETLKPLLGWHGARLTFLALFLIALLRVKTINLVEIATGFRNKAKTGSNYKRLQRFFKDYDLEYSEIARVIMTLMQGKRTQNLTIEQKSDRHQHSGNR